MFYGDFGLVSTFGVAVCNAEVEEGAVVWIRENQF